MPVDLDRMFASLGTDADSVPVPDIASVRSRGNRRRAYQALSVTAAACVAVALVVGGVTALRRTLPVVDVMGGAGSGFAASGPVRFIPLRTVGAPLAFDEPLWFDVSAPGPGRPAAAVVDDRAVLTWQRTDGTVMMGAASLPSGQRLFGPVPVGRYDSWSVTVLSTGILVDGIRADGVPTDAVSRTISWLDRDNGTTRWQLDLPPAKVNVVLARSAIVVASLPQGDLRGIDWTTGQTLWTVTSTGPGRAALGMNTQFDLVPPDPGPAWRTPVLTTDSVVQVSANGVLRLYDARTGQQVGQRQGTGEEVAAFDGIVYSVVADPFRLLSYSVDNQQPVRVVYQAPAGTTFLRSPVPCGAGRICLIEDRTAGGLAVAVDLTTGDRRVLTSTIAGDTLQAVGDRVLLDGRGNGRPALLDPAGRDPMPLAPAGAPAYAARVGPTAVLSFAFAPGPSVPTGDELTDLWVYGIYPEDGSLRPLGKVIVQASGCSFDNRYLVCPTRTGLGIWQFAG